MSVSSSLAASSAALSAATTALLASRGESGALSSFFDAAIPSEVKSVFSEAWQFITGFNIPFIGLTPLQLCFGLTLLITLFRTVRCFCGDR